MPGDELYMETVPFPLMKVVTALMIGITLLFFALLIYPFYTSPVGNTPSPNSLFMVMFWLFGVISILVAQARKLTIRITFEGITIAFGIFKYTILWNNIQRYYLDKNPSMRYGGWGLRIARVNDRWTLAYSVTTCPRVMLELSRGRFRQITFSTKHPEEVMNLITQQIGQKLGHD